MRNGDLDLKQHVERLLQQDARVDPAAVGVTVADAIVSLHGRVKSFLEKEQISELIQQIRGVRAVANELEVDLPLDSKRSDEDIAHAISSVFAWDARIPVNRIRVEVSDGWVTLRGEVRWPFQRSDPEKTAARISGVRGVTNQIELSKPKHKPTTKSQIDSTLLTCGIDDNLDVVVEGDRITVGGKVPSLADRKAIEDAIWAIPGVRVIQNSLMVEWTHQKHL